VAPNLEKIEVGKAYLLQGATSSKSVVLQFHRIYQRSGNIYLRYSKYAFLDGVAEKRLVLLCRDWDHAGTQMEWEEVPLNKLPEGSIQPCRLLSPLNESPGSSIEGDNTELSFYVEWAMTATPVAIRKIRNRSGNVEVDPQDIRRLSTPLRVHNYNCGSGGFTCGLSEAGLSVVLGTEVNQLAFESWKVAHVLLRFIDK
jgi:hypothetical protein